LPGLSQKGSGTSILIHLQSCVIVLAWPGFSGRPGRLRPSAWHRVFSSELNTTARSGRFRFRNRPTTLTELRPEGGVFGDLERVALTQSQPCSRLIRAAVSCPIP